MQVLATGGPTHYPYSQRKPSAIDFAIYKGIRAYFLSISEIHELSSGHIPLIIQYRVSACKLSRKTCILPQNVTIPQFQEAINGLVNVNMQLDTADDIDDASTAPSSDGLFISFAINLRAHFQTLHWKIANEEFGLSENESHARLKSIVDYHVLLLSLSKKLRSIYTPTVFGQFVITSLQVGVIIYQLVTVCKKISYNEIP